MTRGVDQAVDQAVEPGRATSSAVASAVASMARCTGGSPHLKAVSDGKPAETGFKMPPSGNLAEGRDVRPERRAIATPQGDGRRWQGV